MRTDITERARFRARRPDSTRARIRSKQNQAKTKQIQANMFVFCLICLVESGLFKGLCAKKTKKFTPPVTRARVVVEPDFQGALFLVPRPATGLASPVCDGPDLSACSDSADKNTI
jgi:hypothetical protein